MEFKDRIIRVRAKLNYSQEQFAKDFGVAFVTVNRWENGHAMPTKKTLLRIEDYCKIKGINFGEVK